MSKERELLHRLGNVIYIARKAQLSVLEITCHLKGLVKEFEKEEEPRKEKIKMNTKGAIKIIDKCEIELPVGCAKKIINLLERGEKAIKENIVLKEENEKFKKYKKYWEKDRAF